MLRWSAAALVGRLDLAQAPDDRRRVHDLQPRHALAHALGVVVGLRQLLLHAGAAAEDEREPGPAGLERVEEGVVLARVLGQPLARGPGGSSGSPGTPSSSEAKRTSSTPLASCASCLVSRCPCAVLAPRVGVAHEQDALLRLVAGQQHERRAFLVDAGQVQQVAVLAVLVVDVAREDARGRAPVDEHALGADRLHHARAAGLAGRPAARRRQRHRRQEARSSRARHTRSIESPPGRRAYSGLARSRRQPRPGGVRPVLRFREWPGSTRAAAPFAGLAWSRVRRRGRQPAEPATPASGSASPTPVLRAPPERPLHDRLAAGRASRSRPSSTARTSDWDTGARAACGWGGSAATAGRPTTGRRTPRTPAPTSSTRTTPSWAAARLPGEAVRPHVARALAAGASIVVTVPIAGYVAADKAPRWRRQPDARLARDALPRVAPRQGPRLLLPPDTGDRVVYQDEFVAWLESVSDARRDPLAHDLLLARQRARPLGLHPRAHPPDRRRHVRRAGRAHDRVRVGDQGRGAGRRSSSARSATAGPAS